MSACLHGVNDFNVAVVIMQRDYFENAGSRIEPKGKHSLRIVIIQWARDEWRTESGSYVVVADAVLTSRVPDDHDAADH